MDARPAAPGPAAGRRGMSAARETPPPGRWNRPPFLLCWGGADRPLPGRVVRHEILYLMTFCLPRFLDQDFDEKFVTLFHELYHISPQFDGDLRRHAGRYAVHTRSQRGYDEQMAHLARAYLADGADPKLH